MFDQHHSGETAPTAEVGMRSSLAPRSAAIKLVQAAALAAALVPLSTVKADATPITSSCTFSGGTSEDGNFGSCASGPQGGLLFNFFTGPVLEPYAVELRFDEVLHSFAVNIEATANTFAQITSRFDSQFEGWAPVPICPDCTFDDPDDPFDTPQSAPYINFRIADPVPQGTGQGGNDYTSSSTGRGPTVDKGYDLYIYWLEDTNALYPNPQMLHATGTNPFFDQQITTQYFEVLQNSETCQIFGVNCSEGGGLFVVDPGAGGRDNMFTDFTMAAEPTAVPEPASLFLLGTGVSALMYRRRRRAEAPKAEL